MPCIGGRELVRMALEEDFKSDTLIADLSEETISRYVARRATGVLDGGRVADFIPGERSAVIRYGFDGSRP